MFSIRATASRRSSAMSRTTTGILRRPARCAARQRRSPATISYPPSTLRTTIGWMMPLARIERASSSILASSIDVRGWNWLGRRRSVSTSSERSLTAGTGASGMSAERPRPSAGRFSTMVLLRAGGGGGCVAREDFARQREIGFGAARFDVVENARDAVAGSFAEPDVPRDDRLVDALEEKCADVARHLLAQIGA